MELRTFLRFLMTVSAGVGVPVSTVDALHSSRGESRITRTHQGDVVNDVKDQPGTSVNAATCAGRTTEKSLLSTVNTSGIRRRSATATTEASADPNGRSA